MSETNKRDDTWSAAEYNNTASFVYSDKYTQPVLDLLQATAGERILDLGCGTGELTKALQNVVGTGGVIVGIDASANMIEKARGNGVTNARVMDAQKIVWDTEGDFTTGNFDAVFSNATLQWCKESPSSVIEHIWQALKPGGRFVAEMPGFASMAGVRASIHSALARRGMLEKQGFRVDSIGLFPRLTHLPNGLKAWINLFARKSMLGSLTEAQADEIIEEVLRECEVDMCDKEGRWFLVSMRLRFKATKAL